MNRLMNAIPGPTTYYLIGTSYMFFRKSKEQIFDLAMALDKKYAGKKGIFRLVHGVLPEVKVVTVGAINLKPNIYLLFKKGFPLRIFRTNFQINSNY